MDISSSKNKYYKNFLKKKYNHVNSNFDPFDFLHACGKGSDSLLYSQLFMPDFIEVENSILLDFFMDDINKFLYEKEKSNDISKLEASYNLIETIYIFSPEGRDLDSEEEELLSHQIRNAWNAWLKYKYPTRSFKVKVLDPEETGSSYGITFYEIK